MHGNVGAVLLLIPPLLLAITLHEWAHGMSALYLGDPTAKMAGRLTLDPLAHFDPIGTTMLVITTFLTGRPFGWAKPVPVNYYQLHSPKRDMALVAAAGPATNIVLGIVSLLLLRWVSHLQLGSRFEPISGMLFMSAQVNCGLAAFNILPVHPLDGSRILSGLLPYPYSEQYARLEPYGFIVLCVLIMSPATDAILGPLWNLIWTPMTLIAGIFPI